MSVLIASQTAAGVSLERSVATEVTIVASSGIASGEDCVIEIKTDIDGWRSSGKVLTVDSPAVGLLGPLKYRVNKPSSALAYGVEAINSQ